MSAKSFASLPGANHASPAAETRRKRAQRAPNTTVRRARRQSRRPQHFVATCSSDDGDAGFQGVDEGREQAS